MDEKRLSLRFDLDDEIDREIWNFLEDLPKRTKQNTIKIALIHEIKGTNNFGEIKTGNNKGFFEEYIHHSGIPNKTRREHHSNGCSQFYQRPLEAHFFI